jgi:hypothetical protein
MAYIKESHAICLGDSKQAALYFDKVWPLLGWVVTKKDNAEGFEVDDRGINMKVAKDLFPKSPLPEWSITHMPHTFNCLVTEMIKRIEGKNFLETPDHLIAYHYINNTYVPPLASESIPPFSKGEPFRVIIKRLSEDLGFVRPSLLLTSESLIKEEPSMEHDASIILSDLNLIDTSKVTWEQIIDVRKDSEAIRRLRNLKLFFHTNYSGKSKSFVEDDVNRRMEDYDGVCKNFGFETVSTTLTLMLNSKNLRTFGLASLVGIVMGEPLLTSSSLLAGVSLELANLSIEIIKKKHAFNRIEKDHEFAYIFYAQSKLNKKH